MVKLCLLEKGSWKWKGKRRKASKDRHNTFYLLIIEQGVKIQTTIDGAIRRVYDLKLSELTSVRTEKKLTLKH